MKPHRVQLSRKKGWKMPPNTLVVSRPSKWGNLYKVGKDGDAEICVERYRAMIKGNIWSFPSEKDIQSELRGKNLACWCKSSPCHADVLLEIANKTET